MRELRHDFRRYYSCSYDEVDTEEAIDLIYSLPEGAHYIAALNPALSWEPWKHAMADIQDELWQMFWAEHRLEGEAFKVTRPRDIEARKQASIRAKEARKRLKEGTWEEA